MEIANKTCIQPSCKINTSGKCLEGLDTAVCPHFQTIKLQQVLDSIEEEIAEIVPSKREYKLFDGLDILGKDLHLITYKYNCNIIVLIGELDSGKTTLLASLYDLFQLQKINEFTFSGSMTQLAFEKRCHLSRISSGLSKPDTERSKVKEFSFLHLAVKKSDNLSKKAIHLLISDVSGERIQNARNSSDEMKSLEFIRNVNHIMVLIDGKKLADKKLRYSTITNAVTFIQKAIDEKVLNNKNEIFIVISKYDHIPHDGSLNLNDVIINPIQSAFKNKLKKVSFINVAARPDNPSISIPVGYGINELFKIWTSRTDDENTLHSSFNHNSIRSYHNYLLNEL